MNRRKGFAMTIIFFVFLICLSIAMAGLFDIAGPNIKTMKENSQMIVSGINEVKEAITYLWNRHVSHSEPFPSGSITLASLKSTYINREFFLLKWKNTDSIDLKFTNVTNGANVEIKLTMKQYTKFDETIIKSGLKNAVIQGNVITVTLSLRTGKAVL